MRRWTMIGCVGSAMEPAIRGRSGVVANSGASLVPASANGIREAESESESAIEIVLSHASEVKWQGASTRGLYSLDR